MNSMASITMVTWCCQALAHRLVISKATLTLGILEGPLDPVALALHLSQAFQLGVGGRVGEAVLDLFGRPDLATDDRVPPPRRRFFAAPPPDPPMRDVDPQRAARALAQ